MIRTLVVAVLSAVAAAAAVYFGLHRTPSSGIALEIGAAPDAGVTQALVAPNLESVLERASAVSERAAIYELAARADESSLGALIEDAIELPESSVKGVLLGALALRAVDLDADTGLEALGALNLEARQANLLGLTLFEALGPSSENIERVMNALPRMDRRRFRIDALARWADTDAERAFQEALSVDDWQLRSRAVEGVASAWTARDPSGALEEAGRLPDDTVGRAFRTGVVRRLGEVDPAAMVAYVNGSPEHESRLTRVVVDQLALMEPLEALGWAEQLAGRVGEAARQNALQGWGREDPHAAYAYAQAMPLGDERLQLLHAVASGYGRQDPDSALAWLQSLPRAPNDLSASVIAGIAQVDPRRALDLAFADDSANSGDAFGFSRARMGMFNAVIGNVLTSPDVATSELVERVLSLSNQNELSNALTMLTAAWMRVDPEGAFEWVIAEGNLPGPRFSHVIGSFARYDPILAAAYTERVAPSMREIWIANVAQNYARLDPQGAAGWLRQFRGEPAYASGVAAVVQRAVDYDPSIAAALLETVDDSGPNIRDAAGTVAGNWASRDPQGARRWVIGLAAGPVRDSALQGFIGANYRKSIPDAPLLALFSSEEAKQRSLLQTIYSIGADDRDEARRLIDKHVSLPELRAQVLSWLDRSDEERGIRIYRGGVIMGN